MNKTPETSLLSTECFICFGDQNTQKTPCNCSTFHHEACLTRWRSHCSNGYLQHCRTCGAPYGAVNDAREIPNESICCCPS